MQRVQRFAPAADQNAQRIAVHVHPNIAFVIPLGVDGHVHAHELGHVAQEFFCLGFGRDAIRRNDGSLFLNGFLDRLFGLGGGLFRRLLCCGSLDGLCGGSLAGLFGVQAQLHILEHVGFFYVFLHGQTNDYGLGTQQTQKALVAFFQNVDVDVFKADAQLLKAEGNGLFHGFGFGFDRSHFTLSSLTAAALAASCFSSTLLNTMLSTQP